MKIDCFISDSFYVIEVPSMLIFAAALIVFVG